MKRKMERLAAQVDELLDCAIFTQELPDDNDNDYGYHYFLVFRSTWKIIARWRTRQEAIEGLQNILDVGYIEDGCIFYGKFPA